MKLYFVLFILGFASAVPSTTEKPEEYVQDNSNNGELHTGCSDSRSNIVEPIKDENQGKATLDKSRDCAKKKLLEAVRDLPSIFDPLRKLDELAEAGKADIDAIVESYGQALNRSVKFWKGKMENVIRPYLVNPEAYLKLKTDLAFKSLDPKWNGSIQYKEVEKELDELVDNAINKMQNEFDKMDKNDKRTDKPHIDITASAWKKLQAQRALDNAAFGLRFRNQWLKLRAAGGNTSDIPQFRSRVSATTDTYRRLLMDIYSS